MRERTVSVSSAGKSFSVTGWKTGWVTAPAPYIRAVQTVKQFLTYAVSAPYQRAAAYALRNEIPWAEELRKSLQAKRDRLIAGLETAGFTAYRPQGTYFVQADIRPLGFTDGMELARALPEKAASSPSRRRCSTTTPTRAPTSSASRSARRTRSSTRRSSASPGCADCRNLPKNRRPLGGFRP